MIDTAVIMAAGKGTRFGAMTETKPKGFIEFKGISMIERSVGNLISAGIRTIIIGTGYHREWYESLQKIHSQITTVFSPLYAESNSMETLYRCRHKVGCRDFLLLESDLVYEQKALSLLIEDCHKDIMLASDVIKFQDQYYIAVDEDFNLLKCSINKEELMEETGKEPYGELVGIHKISNRFYREMVEDYEKHRHEYIKRGYEFEIEDVAASSRYTEPYVGENGSISENPVRMPHRIPMFVLKPMNLQWYEIDDGNDLNFAESHIKIN